MMGKGCLCKVKPHFINPFEFSGVISEYREQETYYCEAIDIYILALH